MWPVCKSVRRCKTGFPLLCNHHKEELLGFGKVLLRCHDQAGMVIECEDIEVGASSL